MPNPLFSTYRAGENRVTGSTLAVFERIGLDLVAELLATAGQLGDDLATVTYDNQVRNEGAIPDAQIQGRFVWLFETKTERGAYQGEGHGRLQAREHAKQLVDDPHAWLFVLTPDPVQPEWLREPDGIPEDVWDRVVWIGFRELADAMTAVVQDAKRLLPEQTRFLLNELVALYETDGLLTSDDTVVVAARSAWPEYLKTAAYVCQANRAFKEGLTHMGFYVGGAIETAVPRIESKHPGVLFSESEAARLRAVGQTRLADLIDGLLATSDREEGKAYDVYLLSASSAEATVTLSYRILNDTVTAAGRPWAWTLGQRYTSVSKLCSGARKTSEL